MNINLNLIISSLFDLDIDDTDKNKYDDLTMNNKSLDINHIYKLWTLEFYVMFGTYIFEMKNFLCLHIRLDKPNCILYMFYLLCCIPGSKLTGQP